MFVADDLVDALQVPYSCSMRMGGMNPWASRAQNIISDWPSRRFQDPNVNRRPHRRGLACQTQMKSTATKRGGASGRGLRETVLSEWRAETDALNLKTLNCGGAVSTLQCTVRAMVKYKNEIDQRAKKL